jgi:membrane fusion protein, heavy metal efflux system
MKLQNKGKLNPAFTRLTIAAFVITLAFLLQNCHDIKPAEEKTAYVIPDSLLKTISIDTVRRCQLVDIVKLTGMVDFNQDRQVNVYSLVSGKIQDIKAELGDYVREGQVLGVVKSSEMASYGNSLVIAETTLTAAKKQLDATNDLYKAGLASSLDLTNAQAAYDQAVSGVETAKRVLKINSDNRDGDYIIKSPISGFLVQKNVTNNTLVRSDNGNNLFTISDLNDVWVQGFVYEANVEQVHIGDNVEVSILSAPDRVFTGKIDKIMNVLDPVSRVIKVRVVLKNPDYILKPQMFASLVVSNPENRMAICIPGKALIYDKSRYYVLVYKGNGKAEITPVQVINTLNNEAYLSSGVNEGDRIISSLALQIYNELND